MKTIRKRAVLPIYLVGFVWLAAALLFPLYRPVHYVICAVVSLAVLAAAKAVWPDAVIEVPETRPKAEDGGEKAGEASADPELRALMEERDRALSEMRRLNDSIRDETISAQIDRLEATTGKIFAHVMEKPEKKPQLRRFLNYYLPTTIKLLNAYDRMDAAGISGANIDGTKGKIEDMLSTIAAAFDKQLDALFGDEALDISTDIAALESMMAREGLTENTDFQTGPKADA